MEGSEGKVHQKVAVLEKLCVSFFSNLINALIGNWL